MRAFKRFLPFQPITFGEPSDRREREMRGGRERKRGKTQKHPVYAIEVSFFEGYVFNGVLSDASS